MALFRVKHKHVVSFIGFCDEKDERMIVMERAANGSLHKYLNDPTTLTWSQILHICFGAACALEYIHNDIIGVYKGGFKILLDKDWEAKLLICTDQSWYHTKNFDVYSMGMILLEALYGRKSTIEDVNQYLAKMAKNHYEELGDFINPNLRKQMLPESLSIFAEIAYNCLKEQPEQRAEMYAMVIMLKKALEIQWKYENRLRMENVAYLKIPLRQIKLATDNFSDTYRIKSHKYEMMYKAELYHFDSVLTKEVKNKGELPKKKVIINRMFNYKTIPKDFFADIEKLTKCKHPNLLSFLGFCDEDSEMILVFEADFKETLNDYLRSGNNRTNLTWEQRIRIGLDITHGLNYLRKMEGKPSMIHQGIQSDNVFLDKKWIARIANYRFSESNLYDANLWQSSLINLRTSWLQDAIEAPRMLSPQRLVVGDIIYSIGVILFEILTGRSTNDPFHMEDNANGLVSIARQHFREGTLNDMVDPRIMEEAHECAYTLKTGPNQDSLDTFSEIAYQCLVETQSERPTLEVVTKSLEKALHFQVEENMKIPLEVLQLATENFDKKYCIGSGGHGKVYKAELHNFNVRSYLAIKLKSKDEISNMYCTVAIKRIIRTQDGQEKETFISELDVLSRCEHPNIVSLLGCCVEGNEMLLVYEHASNGSLDDYLGSTDKMINLTWTQCLKMCIDIAQGLNYLHTNTEEKRRIIHRDIKSANILLGKNWDIKIADFGLSKFFPVSHNASTINTNYVSGTYVYLDPEYDRTGSLKRASDIYSFGVVLFEIFSGKLAYDSMYMKKKKRGLAPIAQRNYEEGALVNEMFDMKIMDDEAYELGLTLKIRPDHDSLYAFSRIAYQCLAKTQAERPTIEVVIKELNKALYFQENRMKTLRFSLRDIKVGKKNLSDDNCIMRGRNGMLYKGKVEYNNRHNKVYLKRFIGSDEEGFLKEFEVLFKYKHVNIIGIVGYCKEMDEKIIVYEHASKGSLESYLKDTRFSWTERLKVCIDIANGLKFLHGGNLRQDVVIHRDIKSSNILLTHDWKAKICGFEHAVACPTTKEIEYDIKHDVISAKYSDPFYWETKAVTKESDIYSFGVILFDVLCGRLMSRWQLDILIKSCYEVKQLEEIVFEGIKKQVVLKSFTTFQKIAFQCLHKEREERPTAGDIVEQLQEALEFQEAYDKRKAKLDTTYKEILHEFLKSPENHSTLLEKDIYNILSKGILLEDDKLITHILEV